jgi:hypothetical protein
LEQPGTLPCWAAAAELVPGLTRQQQQRQCNCLLYVSCACTQKQAACGGCAAVAVGLVLSWPPGFAHHSFVPHHPLLAPAFPDHPHCHVHPPPQSQLSTKNTELVAAEHGREVQENIASRLRSEVGRATTPTLHD